ncbi:MAG TPA: fatty acid--CoA ligase family protein [Actinomycetota bacterium]
MSGSLHTALDAVLLPRPAAAAAVIRAWEAGRAVLPLDPAAPAAELRRLLGAVRPTHLVDADGRRRLPDGRPLPAGVAAVVATSGTAGAPKVVELTATGLRAAALATSAALGAGAGDRWLACVPLHGVAGLAIVARAWHTGVPLTVQHGFDPDQVDPASGHGATLVSLVPTMLWRLVAAGRDLRGFRRILVGGGPVQPGLLSAAAALGASPVATYGLTETGGGVVHDGHPLDGVELAVGDGLAGAPGGGGPPGAPTVAEVRLRGPMVMRGYHGDPAATAAALRDGWLHTGDLGSLLPDGRLRVLGRRDEVIVTGGVKVHPVEVEQVLSRHPLVGDVAVAGAGDAEWGQRVVAFVVPREPGRPPSLEELRGFAREQLAAAKAPRQLVLVDEVPRSPGGKLLRRDLPVDAPPRPAAGRQGARS